MKKGCNYKNPSIKGNDHFFCNYTEEELVFLKAIDRYKQLSHRPFPTCSEILEVAISLGYRKVKDGT